MLNQSLEIKFLSELSDEQQEMVAGGGQLTELSKKIKTAFEASKTSITNTVGSGAEGSMVENQIDNTAVETKAWEELTTIFD